MKDDFPCQICPSELHASGFHDPPDEDDKHNIRFNALLAAARAVEREWQAGNMSECGLETLKTLHALAVAVAECSK